MQFKEEILQRLTPDPDQWRIDWLGNLDYHTKTGRRRQPFIYVSISKHCPNSADVAQCNATMPISLLPELKIGDIWQNGKLVSSPTTVHSFPDLLISNATVKTVKAGVEVDGEFLLPFEHHPWHRQHTQSYCVIIKANQNTQLIIPCTEMIRFYWGSSGFLMQLLFARVFDEKSFWTHKHFDQETGHLHLKLADSISSACATDIGRMSMSDYSKSCAARIFESCVKASSTLQPVYPHTGFPFIGKTSLTAHGVWLPSDDSMRTFVAHRLVTCSHRFPFTSLTYELGRFKYKIKQEHEARQESAAKKRLTITKGNREQTQTDEDPGARKSVKAYPVSPNVRFPDLLKKPVWHKEIEAIETQIAFIQRADGTVEKVAFGLPEGSSQTRALEVTGTQKRINPEKTENLPQFIVQGLKQIDQRYGPFHFAKTRKLIILADHGTPAFSLPMLVDENGEINTVTQFTEPNGTHRPRQACFVEIRNFLFKVKTVVIAEGLHIKAKQKCLEVARVDQQLLLAELLRFMEFSENSPKPNKMHG